MQQFNHDGRFDEFIESLEGRTGFLALDHDDAKVDTSTPFFDVVRRFGFPIPPGYTPEHFRLSWAHNHGHAWEGTDGFLEKVGPILTYEGEFNRTTPALPGALRAVNELARYGIVGCTLTNRPDEVRNATLENDELCGFPKIPLLTKEPDSGSGSKYKARALMHMFPHIGAILDNDSGIVRTLESMGYEGHIFHFGPASALHKPSRPELYHACPNWTAAFFEISSVYGLTP